MSSIIKGGRIGQETVIDLKERMVAQTNVVVNNNLEDNEENEENNTQNLIYAQAVQERMEIVQSAKEEANMLLAEANAKANSLLEENLLKGQECVAKAQIEAEKILDQAKNQALVIQEEALYEKAACMREAESEIVETVQKLVAHIIHQKVVGHTEWVLLLVKKMIEKENILEATTLYLSEQLYSKITRKYEDAFAELKVTVKQDPSLDEKACVLETNQGSIFYDIEVGLKTVLEELKALQNLQVEV